MLVYQLWALLGNRVDVLCDLAVGDKLAVALWAEGKTSKHRPAAHLGSPSEEHVHEPGLYPEDIAEVAVPARGAQAGVGHVDDDPAFGDREDVGEMADGEVEEELCGQVSMGDGVSSQYNTTDLVAERGPYRSLIWASHLDR